MSSGLCVGLYIYTFFFMSGVNSSSFVRECNNNYGTLATLPKRLHNDVGINTIFQGNAWPILLKLTKRASFAQLKNMVCREERDYPSLVLAAEES